MITKVRVQYFKRFPDETFKFDGDIVLAGPNNSGKTTLLQAISVWNLGVQKWLTEHSESSKAKQRTGFPVTRKDFTAIPLREMNLLWSNRDTAYSKEEKHGVKAGQPKNVAITLWGIDLSNRTEWSLSVAFRYQSKEQVYVKLMDEQGNSLAEIPEAIKKLNIVHVPPFSGIGAAESGKHILYLEDESDFKILQEFAHILDHPMKNFFLLPFFYPLHGRDTKAAKAHFFALKAVHPAIQGVLLLDGDTRKLDEHEVASDNLCILQWKRYEIENYLLHPEALLRFIEGAKPDLFSEKKRVPGEEYLKNNLPPAAFSDPLSDNDYLVSTPASKSLLPNFLNHVETNLPKKDYFHIAAMMKKEEIHPEVKEILDKMAKALKL